MDSRTNRRNKVAFSNSFGLPEERLRRVRFHYGLVWTVDLTVEIKLRFKISPG